MNNIYNQPQFRNTNLDWIIVQNIEQVEKVAVQPAQKAWIMVQNEPIFALRTADMMGLATTEYYRFEKYTPTPKTVGSAYVTNEQFETAIKEIKETLNESINKLTEQPKPAKRKTDGADT